MQYGQVTLEQAAEALIAQGFTQGTREVGYRTKSRFVVESIVPSEVFRKTVGKDVVIARVNCDVDWDQHVVVRWESQSATVQNIIVMGRTGENFAEMMQAFIDRPY